MSYARVVRLGVLILPEYRLPALAERWSRAEELGFDHAWTYDHIAWMDLPDSTWFAAVPTLAAAAHDDVQDPSRHAGRVAQLPASCVLVGSGVAGRLRDRTQS